MEFILDCHCHTTASGHAYSTINEYFKYASEIGLKLVAITDHAPALPGSTHIYYFQNLKILPKELYGVELLKGVEVNILDNEGNLDLPDDLLKELDLVVASVHPPCYKEKTTKNVIKAYIKAMENPNIHIIGHPDDSRFPINYEEFVKAAKQNNVLIEFNNSSLRPTNFRENARENYIKLLEKCRQYNVPIILGSDSHFFMEVGNFEDALKIIDEVKFPRDLIINTSVQKLKKYL